MYLASYVTGLLVGLLTWCAIYKWKRRRMYKLASEMPGPKGYPIIGNALSVFGEDNSAAFKNLTGYAIDYPTPSLVWYGPYCVVLIDQAKDLQIVLNSSKCQDKSEVYQFVGLTKGLVVAGGSLWKTHRKLLDPSFHINVLQSFIPVFNEKSRRLVREFEKRLNQPEDDVFLQLSACTLETLLNTMFGIERDIQSDAQSNTYLHAYEKGSQVMNDRLFKVWLQFEPIFRLSKHYHNYVKYVKNGMFAIAHEILKEKGQKKNSEVSQTKSKKFVDLLLNAKKQLDEEEIVDEINTLIAAVSYKVNYSIRVCFIAN